MPTFLNEHIKLRSNLMCITQEALKDLIASHEKKSLNAKSYKEKLPSLLSLSDEKSISIKNPWEKNVPDGSVAIHFIQGEILYGSSWWYFSTKEFLEDIETAENNPSFISHVIIVDSPGGEAYYCHEAHEIIKSLKKPSISVVNGMMASGALWIASPAKKVYAASMFDRIGSLGVMSTIYDDSEYLKKLGIRIIETYATESTLKNKMVNDILAGKPEDYISRFLDPLQVQFKADVLSARKKTDANSDVYKGDTFFSAAAKEVGLIDGIKSINACIQEAYDLGIQNNSILESTIYTLINN